MTNLTLPPEVLSRWRCVVWSVALGIAIHYVWLNPHGYSGFAAFVGLTALVLLVEGLLFYKGDGSRLPRGVASYAALAFALAVGLGCARTVWQGSLASATSLVLCLGMLGLSLSGQTYGLIRGLIQNMLAVCDGVSTFVGTLASLSIAQRSWRSIGWMAWAVPMLIAGLFAIPLGLSHPDLMRDLETQFQTWFDQLVQWCKQWDYFRWAVFAATAIWCLGLLLPRVWPWSIDEVHEPSPPTTASDLVFRVVRNSLMAVTGLFMAFLVFEFRTLWFHEFPEGFYYAGYAHQGAAWLTIALAMSTAFLSLFFHPSVQRHRQSTVLRRWAIGWFVGNALLIMAVFHRLGIYVAFNGLTSMRLLGYLGVTCVLVGFVWVAYRVYGGRSFVWLIRRQLWTMAGFLFVWTILPADWIAHRWNVSQVQSGVLPPIVQIATHPISDEGLVAIVPLARHADPLIRDGIQYLLAKRIAEVESELSCRDYQGAKQVLLRAIDDADLQLPVLDRPVPNRTEAFQRFYDWAYQWY